MLYKYCTLKKNWSHLQAKHTLNIVVVIWDIFFVTVGVLTSLRASRLISRSSKVND
jgi:hypothetical protein